MTTGVQTHFERLKEMDSALRSVGAAELSLLQLARQKNPGVVIVPAEREEEQQ